MDVAALYPSCKMDPTSKHIEVAIKQRGLTFKEIDSKYLSSYISVLTGGNVAPDIKRLIPEAKKRTTLNSFVTNPKTSQFNKPADVPPEQLSDTDVRKLLALGVAKTVKVVMGNHYFKIGGKIYKQTDGGSIGLDLTVELASIYMTLWDERFLKKCKNLGIKIDLYTRYVDDVVIVCPSINKGWCFDKITKVMKFDPVYQNLDYEDDFRTITILCEIANSLDPYIKMEGDCPSNHVSGRLPVLDVGMWIDEASKVQFSFFKKPMSSPYVNLYRSALPSKTKRESLLQEGLRRLRHMSSSVLSSEKCQIMSNFMNSLRISGYDDSYRYNLLKGIIKGMKKF